MPVVPTRMPTPKPKRIEPAGPSAQSGDVQAALGLVQARPAALAAAARLRARRAADRRVALVVQRVVGQVALVRCAARRPSRSSRRAGCTSRSRACSSYSTGCASARVGDCSRRMPVIQASAPAQRALERGDLARRRSSAPARSRRRVRVLDLDLDAEALLERPPGGERLGEQHAGVDRDDARVGRERARARRPAPTPPSGRSTAGPAAGGGARPPRAMTPRRVMRLGILDRRRAARSTTRARCGPRRRGTSRRRRGASRRG